MKLVGLKRANRPHPRPYQNRIEIPSEASSRLKGSALSRWPNLLEDMENGWNRWDY